MTATQEIVAMNDHRFSWKDSDANSDARATMMHLSTVMSNKDLLQVAENMVAELRSIDLCSDSDRKECENYRRQWVKTYNYVRNILLSRSGGRFRGNVPIHLNYVVGVRNENGIYRG